MDKICIVIIGFIVLTLVTGILCQFDGSVGDPCNENGKQGTCKFAADCSSFIQAIQSGNIRPPKICGFEGTKSIVCCVDSSESTTKNRVVGEVSKRKCMEYAQYVFDVRNSPTFLPRATVVKKYDCPFEKVELIVGGSKASDKEFPHMAQIGYGEGDIQWGCGGSLISENFILTAGHCVSAPRYGPATYARMGLTNLDDVVNMEQIKITEHIEHPGYKKPAHYNDIGLLRLERKPKLSPWIRPACLYTENNFPTRKAIACGWGQVEFEGPTSKELMKVVLEFFDYDVCSKSYRPDTKLRNGISRDSMICAGSTKHIRDTCGGDSGGPFQVYHPDEGDVRCMYDVIGVTSFGKPCGFASNISGIYTKVSRYIKWIEDTVWPEE